MDDRRTDSWLDRPIVEEIGLTWEQGLYILIVILSLVSRLAMLGYRVQSHDESLHCKFSWDLYMGYGFQHNPMMHGPFLFHATALSYFLFGDSDFTARLPVALMGTALVAFPYLLRRYLGRKGALFTSLLFLISPSITYYSRYIRMDIPAILWAMAVIWAIFRYLEEGQAWHLYILAAALSLLYATKEVSAIYTLIVVFFLVGLLVVRALMWPWKKAGAEQVFLIALAGIALGLVVLAVGAFARRPEEGTPLPFWGLAGGFFALIGVFVAGGALLYGLGKRLRTFRSFDLIILIGTLCLPFASPLAILAASRVASLVVARYPSESVVPPFWAHLANVKPTNYTSPDIYYSGAILALVLILTVAIGLAWDRRRWPIAAAIHTFIFLVLFTTVFTNGAGIASGWVGSVGYWLEQQEVERGNQPMFYYLVILPLYDFLPLLGALIAPLYLVGGALMRRLRKQGGLTDLPGMRALFVPFLIVWSALAWFSYSYAGEKMPWLVTHITTPMILLTGWLLARLVEAVDWPKVREHRGWLLALLLPPLAVALVTVLKTAGLGPFRGVELDQLLVTGSFLGGLVGVGMLGVAAGLLWTRIGWRNGFLLAALTGFLILGLLTVRVAYRLSFINFDTPAEFLVYAHEGPDVRTTMETLEELSLRVAGGPGLIDVSYGSDGSWPFTWYLRPNKYPNARYYGDRPNREDVLATAIIAGRDQWSVVEPYVGDDYYRFDYFFLWWPMEDYRKLTWEKLWDWLTTPRKRAALWRIFYNMDYTLYDEITGGHHTPDQWPLRGDFRLYIRKDVVDRLWDFGVSAEHEHEEEAGPADPYAGGWQSMTSVRSWGMEGNGPGQFRWPRGIAVSPDGFVYVADSQNHRIQKFTTDGTFVTSWGSFGGCPDVQPPPGTFCEPWGVAVGSDGSVYVADTWADRVQKFTPDGTFLAEWGAFGQGRPYDLMGHSGFFGPRGVAVGPDGLVYVVDTGNKRVQVFSPEGAFLREWGGGGPLPGQLNEPVGLAFGPDGLAYVTDTWNYRVQVLEPGGEPVREWPIAGWNNQLVEEKPYLAVDAQGRVYVTDPGHYRVLVFDTAGTYLYSLGQFGFDASSFALPMGIAAGPDDLLYVTDAANHRVMVFEVP